MIPAATIDSSVRRLRRRAGGVIALESTAGCITAGLGGTEDNGTIGSRAATAAGASGRPPPADAAHQRPALLRGGELFEVALPLREDAGHRVDAVGVAALRQ